ncbi:hypothetical protein NLI96_g8766 [Meripilus lineatus]|uniref:Uncharacterized protein n=1 Tax=Meripilus lineatus TaxID=2056292 RepID=A0AAD5UX20_9APHY|nr:hypothetical protein NLI96_g8766 [Physisporinus lineatus]
MSNKQASRSLLVLTVCFPVSSDHILNEVFLCSCLDVYDKRSTKLVVEEDEDAANRERLSASYPYTTYDFYGTPSGALCVYKNGDAWPVHTGPESQRIIREAHPVYDHPIRATWRAICERIYTLLDDKKVLWTSIDPLAFAEAGKEIFSPLLLWIGVQPASLFYEDANTVAEAITFFLDEAGFEGIEIGFRESVVTRSTFDPKMPSFSPLRGSLPEFRKPFAPTLGLSIAPLNTPYSLLPRKQGERSCPPPHLCPRRSPSSCPSQLGPISQEPSP